MRRFLLIGMCTALLTSLMCTKDLSVGAKNDIQSVQIELKLTGPIYQGSFYSGYLPRTDYAVWIETADGHYVKTLHITKSVVSVGEYSHVEHLPAWAAKSGITYDKLIEDLSPDTAGVAPSFNGVTGASPYFAAEAVQTFTVAWDLKDGNNASVSSGRYRFCAESANITKGVDALVTIQAENTAGILDLDKSTVTSAAPTTHIASLTASYILQAK